MTLDLEFSPIQTVEDFVAYTKFHKERVLDIGIEIFQKYSQEFTLIEEKKLISFLNLHDEAKILFLKDRYIFGHKLFHNVFGRDIKSLEELERKRAQDLIKVVNHYDSQIARQFFKEWGMIENGLLTAEALEYKRIEQLADMIERGLNPLASLEFGRPMKLASELLRDPLEIQIAKSFE